MQSDPAASFAAKAKSRRSYRVGGIHLSGPNAQKTSLVVARGRILEEPLEIEGVYERIGSYGKLFSDERLVELLAGHGPFQEVVVDCPLTLPPCVRCVRSSCPGAIQCEDLAVAYMLAVSERERPRRQRRARPVNPQSQRLWDVLQLGADGSFSEPTYSANVAPLVTRARTLQRRLNGGKLPIRLRETSVPHTLSVLGEGCGEDWSLYRNFERGLEVRKGFYDSMVEQNWLQAVEDQETRSILLRSADVFHALVSAIVAGFRGVGLCRRPPDTYLLEEGWVDIPELQCSADADHGCDLALGQTRLPGASMFLA